MKAPLFAILFTLPCIAHASTLNCQAGNPDGDSLVRVSIDSHSRSEAVSINFWESGIVLSKKDIVKNGNSIAILSKKTTYSVEGEEEEAVVDALFVFNSETKTLNATVLLNGSPTQLLATDMSCK